MKTLLENTEGEEQFILHLYPEVHFAETSDNNSRRTWCYSRNQDPRLVSYNALSSSIPSCCDAKFPILRSQAFEVMCVYFSSLDYMPCIVLWLCVCEVQC